MRVVIQRVSEATVTANGKVTGSIGKGLLILLGIEDGDDQEDIDWLCQKIGKLRVFNDEEGLMNLSVQDVDGELMVVSQFTLHASTKKGNRPSFIRASKPEVAIPIYEKFIKVLEIRAGRSVATGEFGADMQIQLVNDGPVTITMDSKARE